MKLREITRVAAYQVDTNHVAGIGIISPLLVGVIDISVGITFLAIVGIPPFLPSLFV